MAYGIVHHFPGGTKEQYEASIAAVHPTREGLPEGQIFHVAGASAGGWTIVAVHESRESWERFRDDILMPRIEQGIEGGFATSPQETSFDVHVTKASAKPVKSAKKMPAKTTAKKAGPKQAVKKGPAKKAAPKQSIKKAASKKAVKKVTKKIAPKRAKVKK